MVKEKFLLKKQTMNMLSFIKVSIKISKDKQYIIFFVKYVSNLYIFYIECWEFEPEDRPDISEIVSILKSINSEKNKTTKSEESEITKELENDNLSCQIRNY
jgi:hypothetical protein